MLTANPLFVTNNIPFTSGESTNATHYATIIIPSNATEHYKIFIATLRPVPADANAVHIIYNQAIITIIENQSKMCKYTCDE